MAVRLQDLVKKQVAFVEQKRFFTQDSSLISIQGHSGKPSTLEQLHDRFTVTIKFVGRQLKWMVLYQNGRNPPDVVFEHIEEGFLPQISAVPSLLNWDRRNPASLHNILRELLLEYEAFQDNVVCSHPRLDIREGYKALKAAEEYDMKATTYLVDKANVPSVKLYIRFTNLHLELPNSPLQEGLAQKPMKVALTLEYSPHNMTPAARIVFLNTSPVLQPLQDVDVPTWQENTQLESFVNCLRTTIKDKFMLHTESLVKRRQYIASFLSLFGSALLEYDVVSFNRISFLFEVEEFFAVVHIKLSSKFPAEKPQIVLQSIYSEGSEPKKQVYDEYPWSPRWSSDEMAIRARTFLLETFPQFRNAS